MSTNELIKHFEVLSGSTLHESVMYHSIIFA